MGGGLSLSLGHRNFVFFCFFCFGFFGRSRDNQQPFLTHTPTNCTNNGEESNEEEFDEKEESNEEEEFNEEEKLGEEEVKRVFAACVQDSNGILVGQDPLFSLEIAQCRSQQAVGFPFHPCVGLTPSFFSFRGKEGSVSYFFHQKTKTIV